MEFNKILENIINDIIHSNSGKTFTSYELFKKHMSKNDFKDDFDYLSDLHNQLSNALEEINLEIEFMEDGIVGLYYKIPFIVVQKNIY